MISVSNLNKSYGPRVAVDNVTFEVQKGEIVGFLGPNGAGKSTTMKILSGFMPASDGKAVVAGFDVFDKPLEVKKNVGYLPENPPVYLEMTVSDYLEFAAQVNLVPKSDLKKQVSWAIEKTSLGDVRGRVIGNLSKGYRQRVGLAQALVHNPQVLILDEPTVGLDPRQIIEIRDLIKSLRGDHTVILSTHILPEVTATCQRIIVINRGKIVAHDALDQLQGKVAEDQVYTLTTRKPSPAALSAISALPGVLSAQTEGDSVKIHLKGGSPEIRDKIVETAVKNEMGVLEFSTRRLSLEEIYLKLTSGE